MDNKIKLVFSEFHLLHKTMKKIMTRKVKDIGLSLDQCRLLFLLNCDMNINQKKLANALHISEATLSVRLSRLEKSGYIMKKVDEEDKRNFSLELTETGKAVLKDGYMSLNVLMKSMFEGISEEELDMMLVLFNKIKSNIEGRGE